MQDAQLIQPNNEHKLLMLYQQFIGVSALQQQQQKGRICTDKWGQSLCGRKNMKIKSLGSQKCTSRSHVISWH